MFRPTVESVITANSTKTCSLGFRQKQKFHRVKWVERNAGKGTEIPAQMKGMFTIMQYFASPFTCQPDRFPSFYTNGWGGLDVVIWPQSSGKMVEMKYRAFFFLRGEAQDFWRKTGLCGYFRLRCLTYSCFYSFIVYSSSGICTAHFGCRWRSPVEMSAAVRLSVLTSLFSHHYDHVQLWTSKVPTLQKKWCSLLLVLWVTANWDEDIHRITCVDVHTFIINRNQGLVFKVAGNVNHLTKGASVKRQAPGR